MDVAPESIVTLRQLQSLLSITNTLRPYVIDASDPGWIDGGEKRPNFDGGCAAAAQTTFINTCARMDALLSDPNRWDLREAANAATIRQVFAKQQETPERAPDARAENLMAIVERLRSLREKEGGPKEGGTPTLPKPGDPNQLF